MSAWEGSRSQEMSEKEKERIAAAAKQVIKAFPPTPPAFANEFLRLDAQKQAMQAKNEARIVSDALARTDLFQVVIRGMEGQHWGKRASMEVIDGILKAIRAHFTEQSIGNPALGGANATPRSEAEGTNPSNRAPSQEAT